MAHVVKTLKMRDSGLDVKTRMWLKITIPDAFIGKISIHIVVGSALYLHVCFCVQGIFLCCL